MFGRLFIVITMLLGAAGLSQGPSLSQQYTQRLGGAIDELRTIVEQFDRDVAQNNLTRERALEIYAESTEKFLKDRGLSMKIVLDRLEDLLWQKSELVQRTDIMQPFFIAQHADEKIISGVFEDYEPSMQFSADGVFFGSFGAIIGLFSSVFLRGVGRKGASSLRRNKKISA